MATAAQPRERVWHAPVISISYAAFPPPLYQVEYDLKTHHYRKAIGVADGSGHYEAVWKERTLPAPQHTALVAFLESLVLVKRVDAPPLPPGGSAYFTLHEERGDKKLAVLGQGTYFELDPAQGEKLDQLLVQLVPDAEWDKK